MANTEEADKRLVEAADAVIGASELLGEARSTLDDPRFGSEKEPERLQAFQAAQRATENAVKKLEEALKKATVAAAVRGASGAFAQYRAVGDKLTLARAELKAAPNADGGAAKQERLRAGIGAADEALAIVQGLVFA